MMPTAYVYLSDAKLAREFRLAPGPATTNEVTLGLPEDLGIPLQLGFTRTVSQSYDGQARRIFDSLARNALDIHDETLTAGHWIKLDEWFGFMEVYRDTADRDGERRSGVVAFMAVAQPAREGPKTLVFLSGSVRHMTEGPPDGHRLGSGTESLYDALRQHGRLTGYLDGDEPATWVSADEEHATRERVLRNGYGALSYQRDRATIQRLAGVARVISVYPDSDEGPRFVLATPLYLENAAHLLPKTADRQPEPVRGLRRFRQILAR